MTSARAGGTSRRLLVAIALALLAILAAPATSAEAHARLVKTAPTQGDVVDPAPTEVVLTFTEPVDPVPGRVRVVAPDRSRVDQGDPRSEGSTVRIPLRAGLGQGTYTVTFRVISSDSHPIGGAFSFSIIAPSPGGAPSADESAGEVSRALRTVFPIVRWFGYAGLVLLVGAVLMLAALWPQRLGRRGPLWLAWVGAALIGLSTIAELVLQIPYTTGGSLADATKTDVQEVLGSQFGSAHLARLGVVAVAVPLVRIVGKAGWGGSWTADRVLLAVLGVIGLATWPLSGHPGASPVPLITVLADLIHLAAMSAWLGGLIMLLVFLLPRANAGELGAIVPIWSRWAGYGVSALILTGVAQALVEVGTVDGLLDSTYGRLVITKVALVIGLLGVAALSRRLVGSIEAEQEGAGRRLRLLVGAETTIVAVVIAVASVLVQTTPGRTATTPVTTDTTQQVTLTSQYYSLQLQVVPAKVGNIYTHLLAFGADGKPIDVLEWQGKASLPAKGIEAIPIDMLPISPDHATGQVTLPEAGSWTFTFTLRVSEINQSSATATIPIAAD